MDAKDQSLAKTVARIDARIRDKLVKHARKHGMTDREAVELDEAWKQAPKHTSKLASLVQRPANRDIGVATPDRHVDDHAADPGRSSALADPVQEH